MGPNGENPLIPTGTLLVLWGTKNYDRMSGRSLGVLCGKTHPSHNTPSTTFLHNSSMNMHYNVGEVEKGKRFSTLGKTEEL